VQPDDGIVATQRGETGRRAEPRVQRAPSSTGRTVGGAEVQSRGDGSSRRAVPRISRPRGDNVATGVAVPRASLPPARVIDRGRVVRRTVLVPRTTVFYNNYYYAYPRYYYPRRYYPYGFGAFGIGYYYYDPYVWYPHHHYRFTGYGYGYPTGELRLDVSPKHAEVYVDGYFAGIVDDFDGIFQALRLEEGPYRIEIVAPGYEPIEFDVRIQPGRKITYRQDLLPALQP
jgi:hypothetical protein